MAIATHTGQNQADDNANLKNEGFTKNDITIVIFPQVGYLLIRGVSFTNTFLQSTNVLVHSVWYKRRQSVLPTKSYTTVLVNTTRIYTQTLDSNP